MRIRSHAIVLTALLAALLAVSCGGGDSATAVANRLTDSLAFDNGTVREGPPPAANDGDPAYPQATGITAPPAILVGQPFTVTIDSDYQGSDLAGAVVFVRSATSHIEVTAAADPESGAVTLTGTLTGNDEIPGDAYTVEVALRNNAGAVGNYLAWSVTTPRSLKDCESACDRLASKGCLEQGEEQYCPEECAAAAPSLDCFACINLDSCEEIWNCISIECGSDVPPQY